MAAGYWRGQIDFILQTVSITYLMVVLFLYLGNEPYRNVFLVLTVFPIGYLIWKLQQRALGEIHERISHTLGRPLMSRFRVHSRDLPAYRFVDLYRATAAFCEEHGATEIIESEHTEDLNSLLHGKPYQGALRKMKTPGRIAWPVGPGKEEFFPVDRFWLRAKSSPGRSSRMVVRLHYDLLQWKVVLEIAGEVVADAEEAMRQILSQSSRESIYRNRVLEMGFEAAVQDDYGQIERPDRMLVHFKPDDPVGDEDIILEEEARQILWRNVIDLQTNRDTLKAHGVPVRRGVLFYGPPGTGKTYACRYLYGKLPETTTIVVTGTALLHVKSIFNFARMLQPSLVILEDVDLVFQSRDVNLYSSVLGELMDQMDGLRPDEDIGFILTTNAIERLEVAIKDRPGRISQCIHFGAPPPDLRRRYLARYLRDYETGGVDVDHLISLSDGATQAFLKEWVFRAAQLAVERLKESNGDLELRTDDFDRAMEEMRKYTEDATAKIIGFGSKS